MLLTMVLLQVAATAAPAAPAAPGVGFVNSGFRTVVQLTPAGEIASCKTESLGVADAELKGSDLCPMLLLGKAAVLEKIVGQPLAPFRKIELSLRLAVAPADPAAEPLAPGDMRRLLSQSRLTVGPDGRVSSCASPVVGDFLGNRMDLCVITRSRDGSPDFAPNPGAPVRSGTVSFQIIARHR